MIIKLEKLDQARLLSSISSVTMPTYKNWDVNLIKEKLQKLNDEDLENKSAEPMESKTSGAKLYDLALIKLHAKQI